MNDLYDSLRQNLETEIELREQLLELMAEKRHHLVHGDVDRLGETLRTMHPLLERALQLQTEREAVLRQRAPKAGQVPPLRELVARAPRDLRGLLDRLRERLKQLLERTAQENRINTRLVRQSQSLHADLLQRLSGERPKAATYTARGLKSDDDSPARPLVSRQL